MSDVKLDDVNNLKNKIFKKNNKVKEEYKKKKPMNQLQKEMIKARIAKGLSQKELAELVDTSQSVISKLENDEEYNPNLKTLIKVSEALNKELNISLK
ncbi:MAG: helix-turn-helix transcriptional regulator [Bacillota bacterium]